MTNKTPHFCDYCGHVFMNPQRVGLFTILEVCPKCGNPNFEILTRQNEYSNNLVHISYPLGGRFRPTKP